MMENDLRQLESRNPKLFMAMVCEAVLSSHGSYEIPMTDEQLMELVNAHTGLDLAKKVMQETMLRLTVEALL